MTDNRGPSGYFGVIVGGIGALAVILLLATGGELGGKKTINSDADLPPVLTSPQ